MSDSLSTFSKYIPAKPDIKQAANAAQNPRALDSEPLPLDLETLSVEDSCTKAIPAAKIPRAHHCHF